MKIKHYISGILIGVIVSLLLPLFCSAETTETVVTTQDGVIFTDVSKGHSEYVAIKYLKDVGIINGYTDGSFKPDNYINRVEALKIILEANKIITDKYISDNKIGGTNFSNNQELISFSDIFKSQWYFPYLKKAVEKEIATGYPDNTFRPLETVNRVESYKMVMESDGILLPEVVENPFADVSIYEWFSPYIMEAKLREIVYITMQNLVYPGRLMTRSKFSELVYRYMRSKIGSRFGKGTFYSDYFEGRGTSSGEPYRASELTAAHLTLPFGTIVKVTNLANGESVTVRINDRGPFVTGRVIDLSKSAFQQIAHLGSGIIWVEYEILNEV